jgi:peptide subunit release factor 1 (eRF1)
MISKIDIDALLERKSAPESPVLSVYLDVDQSKAVNLNREFEAQLQDILRSAAAGATETQAESFAAAAARVRGFVSGLEPIGKGVIVFADAAEKFFWAREVMVPLESRARWSETPYLLPLLKILDEHERYGVVLVDKARARLFTVFLGEIEEHADAVAPAEVRRYKTSGTDHMLSENKSQSNADMHVRWHLKHTAETVDKLIDRYGFDRLLVAGPVEATSELHHLLSKRARARAAARIPLPVESHPREVLDATLAVERQVERRTEKQIVQDLIDGNSHHPVTHGLKPTLRALAERRIWRLVYADGVRTRGGRCSNCGMLLALTEGACDYCGGAVQPVDDLLEQMAERVLESDGKIEEVEGDAAARLQEKGGIGAFLRF